MRLTLLFYCLLFSLASTAQQNTILYHIHDISQSNYLNPAIPSKCEWSIGVPMLDNVSAAGMGTFSYNDLDSGADYLDTEYILAKMKNHNIFSANATVNILRVGYRKEKKYMQITVNERVEGFAYANKAPFEILFNGNGQYLGENIKGEFNVKAVHYREYAFNYSKEYKENLWIGFRPKLLFGRSGIKSKRGSVNFYTDPNTYKLTLSSDIDINASVPGTVSFDNEGYVSKLDADFQSKDLIFSPTNIGAGLDFGVIKQSPTGISYSFSLLNLGVISWSKNKKNFAQKTSVTYAGATAGVNSWNEFSDTLKSIAKLNYTEKGYTQMLSPVLMLGANAPVSRYLRMGVTLMGEMQSKSMPYTGTLSLFTQNLSAITAGVSYSVTNTSYANFGLVTGFRFGAVEFHVLADNIIASMSPKYMTVQFGMNIRLGCGNSDNEPLCAAYKNSNYNRKIKSLSCKNSNRKMKKRLK